jgi:MoaA/NifB/PqqE/SkfB family radical SAM enzyme
LICFSILNLLIRDYMAIKDPYYEKLGTDEFQLWKGKEPPLVTLDIELTERCNCNCIHCYINLPADDWKTMERELSTEEVKGVLQEAVSLGCLKVRFTGGEPLLREDFAEVYMFARRLGLRVALFTNATLITPELSTLLASTPPLEPIEITVYGMARDSYESVTRASGSFEAAWRGINLLLEQGIPFIVKGAILPPNKLEVERFESWASTIPWMKRPPSYSILFDLRSRRDSLQKNHLIQGLRLSPDEVVEFNSRRREDYLKEMGEFFTKFTRSPGRDIFPCGAGVSGGCVDAYGTLQLCLLLRHPDTVYDLKEGSLENAITGFFPKVRQMKAQNLNYLNQCACCFLNGYCEQCPAKSWMEHGTLDTPVGYFCEVAHAQARYLGLLGNGEMSWEVGDWYERVKRFSGSELINRDNGSFRNASR